MFDLGLTRLEGQKHRVHTGNNVVTKDAPELMDQKSPPRTIMQVRG